jgi:hypothetical protein
MAAARKHRELSETAALVTEILAGRPAPPLPASITAALEQLRAAGTLNATAMVAGNPAER